MHFIAGTYLEFALIHQDSNSVSAFKFQKFSRGFQEFSHMFCKSFLGKPDHFSMLIMHYITKLYKYHYFS